MSQGAGYVTMKGWIKRGKYLRGKKIMYLQPTVLYL